MNKPSCHIPNSFQEDTKFISPQKALAMGKTPPGVDNPGHAVDKAPKKVSKGGY